MRSFPRGQRRTQCGLSWLYPCWCLQPVAQFGFLKVNLKRQAPVRALLRRVLTHRQRHLWNTCSNQRRLIFMPTTHPSLNAFDMFALGTLRLQPEQSSTSYAVNFFRSSERARLSGCLLRRSRPLGLNSTLEFKPQTGVNGHGSYRIGTRICHQHCKTDLIRCDRQKKLPNSDGPLHTVGR
jgi:hypothetical protein